VIAHWRARRGARTIWRRVMVMGPVYHIEDVLSNDHGHDEDRLQILDGNVNFFTIDRKSAAQRQN